MNTTVLPGTQIEILNPAIERGRIRHVLFDFDGTISLLREGWERIMAPVCVEMICGDHAPTQEIIAEVDAMIEETTGIQTIFQMERLVDMVRAHGLVPENQMRDAAGYKRVYNERLLKPVQERINRLCKGQLTLDAVTVRGAQNFLDGLKARGAHLYVFSGTDREDVRREAQVVGVAEYFEEIWGALPSKEAYSKEKVIREIIARHELHGPEVLAVGDGPVEIRNVKEQGGIAVGVCSDEVRGSGWNDKKRARLTKAGADILVPDFKQAEALLEYLYGH